MKKALKKKYAELSIGWSDFALNRHKPGKGHSYFNGSDKELFNLIKSNWENRIIGDGVESIDDACIVPVDPLNFITTKVKVSEATNWTVKPVKRQENENLFMKVELEGPTVECNYVKIVLYSANELLKNGGIRSTDCDWEIVCIIASDIPVEPMHPLTMARNQLEKTGGTPRKYTSEEWANAVWYWSQYHSVRSDI